MLTENVMKEPRRAARETAQGGVKSYATWAASALVVLAFLGLGAIVIAHWSANGESETEAGAQGIAQRGNVAVLGGQHTAARVKAVSGNEEPTQNAEREADIARIQEGAAKRKTADFASMEKALGGSLPPELRTLTARHHALASAFDSASADYDVLDAAYTKAVREGHADASRRVDLDAKANDLARQAATIATLNGEIASKFQAAFESRIAAMDH